MIRKGFLLEAGASYDFAIPLIWQLTKEIKKAFPPEKLEYINKSKWAGKLSSIAMNIIKNIMARDDLHYEEILGALELERKRSYTNELNSHKPA